MVAGDVDKRAADEIGVASTGFNSSVVEDEASERFSGVFVIVDFIVFAVLVVGIV